MKFPSPIVVVSHTPEDELTGPLRLDALFLPGSRWTTEAVCSRRIGFIASTMTCLVNLIRVDWYPPGALEPANPGICGPNGMNAAKVLDDDRKLR